MGFENNQASNKVETSNVKSLEELKQGAVALSGSHLNSLGSTIDSATDYPANSWNEHNGVMIFTDGEGGIFASPITDRLRDSMYASPDLKKDESIGVPNLNESEVWHKDAAQADLIDTFTKWKGLASEARDVQALERNERLAAAELETAAREERLNGNPEEVIDGSQYKV